MPVDPTKSAGRGKGSAKGQGSANDKEKPCPICGKPATEASRPFCSERCRDVDLNRWLSGSYVVPGREDEDEDQE
jgi:endogenous inhibitor of DNA gyrase (YacG/DUF329 family)